jgi:hypothetical protein
MIKRKHTRIALDQTTRNQKRLSSTRDAHVRLVATVLTSTATIKIAPWTRLIR